MAGNTLAVDQIVLHFWGGFLSFLKGEEKKVKSFVLIKKLKMILFSVMICVS